MAINVVNAIMAFSDVYGIHTQDMASTLIPVATTTGTTFRILASRHLWFLLDLSAGGSAATATAAPRLHDSAVEVPDSDG